MLHTDTNTKGFNQIYAKYFRYLRYIILAKDLKLPEGFDDPMPELEKFINGNGDAKKASSLSMYYFQHFLDNWKELSSHERHALQAWSAALFCECKSMEQLEALIDRVETANYSNMGPVDKLFSNFE